MYHIKREILEGVKLYLYFHFNQNTGENMLMWTGNINNPLIWHTGDLQEAMDMLLYIDNLALQGKIHPVECVDVIDENGIEVYL